MKRSTLSVICGAVMLIAGGVLLFGPYEMFPLWAIWLLGPLLWYLGFAISVVGLAVHFSSCLGAKRRSKSYSRCNTSHRVALLAASRVRYRQWALLSCDGRTLRVAHGEQSSRAR
jgi:hypothetical protein